MERMMTYLSANEILASNLQPDNRCISKQVAIDAKSSISEMDAFIANQKVPASFTAQRLMPVGAVTSDYAKDGRIFPADDYIITREAVPTKDATDSLFAGYKYVVTRIAFKDDASNANQSVTAVDNGDNTTTYTRDWVSVTIVEDRGLTGSQTVASKMNDGFYKLLNNSLCMSGGIKYSVTNNSGARRTATIYFECQKVYVGDQLLNEVINGDTSTDYKCVEYENIWSPFYVTLTQAPADGIADPEAGSTITSFGSASSIKVTHAYSSDTELDMIVYHPGANFYGRWWDSKGFTTHPNITNTPKLTAASYVNITENPGSTSLDIDCANFKSETGETGNARFVVFVNWNKMKVGSSSDKHVVTATNNRSQTVSFQAGGQTITKTITSSGAGNLNFLYTSEYTYVDDNDHSKGRMYKVRSTDETLDAVVGRYTSAYEVVYMANSGDIVVKNLDSWDSWKSAGTYSLIYPVYDAVSGNLVRVEPDGDDYTTRNYKTTSNVSRGKIKLKLHSSQNGGAKAYIVSKYYPETSATDNDTYIINEQTLSNGKSITVKPSASDNTVTIDFGNVSSGSGVTRWLKFQQQDSPEYMNLSFTFNE